MSIVYIKAANGYMVRHRPEGGMAYEHRDVWEAAHGPIPRTHHIHHKNKDRSDNRLENLESIEARDHLRMHGLTLEGVNRFNNAKARAPKRMFDCVVCDKHGETRHGTQKFCSKGCSLKHFRWLNNAHKYALRVAKRIKAKCCVCQKPFVVTRNSTTCSPKCSHTAAGRRYSITKGHTPRPQNILL